MVFHYVIILTRIYASVHSYTEGNLLSISKNFMNYRMISKELMERKAYVTHMALLLL